MAFNQINDLRPQQGSCKTREGGDKVYDYQGSQLLVPRKDSFESYASRDANGSLDARCDRPSIMNPRAEGSLATSIRDLACLLVELAKDKRRDDNEARILQRQGSIAGLQVESKFMKESATSQLYLGTYAATVNALAQKTKFKDSKRIANAGSKAMETFKNVGMENQYLRAPGELVDNFKDLAVIFEDLAAQVHGTKSRGYNEANQALSQDMAFSERIIASASRILESVDRNENAVASAIAGLV